MRALVWVVLAATVGFAEAEAPAPDEAGVRNLWRRFEQYYSAGDADGVAGLYTQDADRLTPDGNARGRAAIRAQYATELTGVAQSKAGPIHDTIAIRFLRPDVALIDGEFPDESDAGPVTGLYTVVAIKNQGRWWIAAGRPRGVVPRRTAVPSPTP